MYSNLIINIKKKSNVCFSYTDRLNSYLHFHCSNQDLTDGLRYEDKVLIKNIYFYDKAKSKTYTINDCIEIKYTPYFVLFYFEFGVLQLSLIINSKNHITTLPVLYIEYSFKEKKNIKILFSADKNNEVYYYSSNGNLLESEIINSFSSYNGNDNSFYIAFEKNIDKNKLSNLYAIHINEIDNFFKNIYFELPKSENDFSQSVQWAMFSGWLLVTGKEDRGIWAGLPWFRDNWGRDTFISYPGILLVTGQFEEAKSVITSFANYQDKNPQSNTYGRIPNRYRNNEDVIYNTADGTLWFIREVWEYIQYTGDKEFLSNLWPVIKLAISSDMERRTDENGFLLHGDADTWMDARINGNQPWSPRGSKGNDIQVLWFTALYIGSKFAEFADEKEYSTLLEKEADRVKSNFIKYFFDSSNKLIIDCIDNDYKKNISIRPNQFFCFSIPLVYNSSNKKKLDFSFVKKVIINAVNNLVLPYGVLSLAQSDEYFHPYHDKCELYHKDAAYHNGTIWLWNTGAVIDSLCLINEQQKAYELSKTHCEQMIDTVSNKFDSRCVGSLSENINAYKVNGKICPSGTWSQAWSVAEYARNAMQSYLGIRLDIINNSINFAPHFPKQWTFGKVLIPLVNNKCTLSWKKISKNTQEKTVEYEYCFKLDKKENLSITLFQEEYKIQVFDFDANNECKFTSEIKYENDVSFAKSMKNNLFTKKHNSIKEKNYLEKIILNRDNSYFSPVK